MSDYSTALWRKLRQYLFLLSSCRTRDELLHTATVEVQSLISFDAAAGVFSAVDASFLAGTGMSDTVNASYNSYYRMRQPYFLDRVRRRMNLDMLLSTHIMHWRSFDYLEFASDFMIPNGMWKSLAFLRSGQKVVMSIHRSRSSPDFTEVDVDTMSMINEYVNNLSSGFVERNAADGPTLSAREIAESFRSLSTREAEVCALLARRLKTAEIATCLFVSPRTIEKHVESIFFKLEVRSRDQLRWRLGVRLPPAG